MSFRICNGLRFTALNIESFHRATNAFFFVLLLGHAHRLKVWTLRE